MNQHNTLVWIARSVQRPAIDAALRRAEEAGIQTERIIGPTHPDMPQLFGERTTTARYNMLRDNVNAVVCIGDDQFIPGLIADATRCMFNIHVEKPGHIEVVNVKTTEANVTYVGRKCGKWTDSPLGNPHPVDKPCTICGCTHNRGEAIAPYKQWLWAAMQNPESPQSIELHRILAEYRQGFRIWLGCWCAPLPCHAEIVRDAVFYLNRKESLS